MIDAVVPGPGSSLDIYVQPLIAGQTAQIDIFNTYALPVTSARFYFNFNTNQLDILVREPCGTATVDCTANSFPIQPGRSRPITVVCPSENLGAGQSTVRSLTVDVTFSDNSMAQDTVSVTCAGEDETIKIFTTQLVLPNTPTGMTSTGTIRITSEFPGPAGPPIELMSLGDPVNFSVTSCLNNSCSTHTSITHNVGIACHPQSPGAYSTTMTIKGSNAMTQTTLTCVAYGPSTGPSEDGGGGDGRPDAGPGGGPGGSLRDPESFYACSTSAFAGLVPIVFAITLAAFRRRRRSRRAGTEPSA